MYLNAKSNIFANIFGKLCSNFRNIGLLLCQTLAYVFAGWFPCKTMMLRLGILIKMTIIS